MRISIVEILGLVLFLGWFYSCLFDFLRFYRAVAFEYAIELSDIGRSGHIRSYGLFISSDLLE